MKRQEMITILLTKDELWQIRSVIENGWDDGMYAEGRLTKDQIEACMSAGAKLGARMTEPEVQEEEGGEA